MASTVPPVKGSAYTFECSLISQADTDIFQTTVTLAAGDVKVSKDGGSFNNITALPTEIGTSGVLTVALTGTEMTADRVAVKFTDAADDEWCDLLIVIHTAAQTLDTIDGNVDAILADTGTDGVVLANDAITSAKFDESTAFPLKAADSGSTYIARTGADSDTLETLSDQLDGQEPADVWGYATRTLTQSAASVAAAVAGSVVSIMRGDSLSASFTDLGDISTRSKLWFTVKDDRSDADASSIIQIEESAGLAYLNAADASARAANGSITVTDENAGDLTIALDEAETDDLSIHGGLYYDIQMLTAAGAVTTLTEGRARVTADVTRTVT